MNVDKYVSRFRKAAAKYPTPEAFVEAVANGELVRKGDYVYDRDLRQVGGFVVGEGTLSTRNWPAWVVRRGNGDKELILKDQAVHAHGIAGIACLHPDFQWPADVQAAA